MHNERTLRRPFLLMHARNSLQNSTVGVGCYLHPLLDVLLLRRVQDAPDGQPFWQSVTGAKVLPKNPGLLPRKERYAKRLAWPVMARLSGCRIGVWKTSIRYFRSGCTATLRGVA